MNRIADRTIGAFLSDIASAEPSPGAGAASGVALALASAVARKALIMTLKHHTERSALRDACDRLSAIGKEALALADEDAARFAAMLAAKQEEQGTAAHLAADQALALDHLAKHMLKLCEEADAIVETARGHINANMANDLTAALSLSASAAAIQYANASDLGVEGSP